MPSSFSLRFPVPSFPCGFLILRFPVVSWSHHEHKHPSNQSGWYTPPSLPWFSSFFIFPLKQDNIALFGHKCILGSYGLCWMLGIVLLRRIDGGTFLDFYVCLLTILKHFWQRLQIVFSKSSAPPQSSPPEPTWKQVQQDVNHLRYNLHPSPPEYTVDTSSRLFNSKKTFLVLSFLGYFYTCLLLYVFDTITLGNSLSLSLQGRDR